MRALLRDAQDQTRIALEVEEAVYDPKDNKLFLYTTSETCYAAVSYTHLTLPTKLEV